jgi:hypothetical protein
MAVEDAEREVKKAKKKIVARRGNASLSHARHCPEHDTRGGGEY